MFAMLLSAACDIEDPVVDAGVWQVREEIDPAVGGTVQLENGPKLDFPAGALPPGENIQISVSVSAVVPPAEAQSAIWEFGPAGTEFLMPVPVRMPFDLDGRDASKFAVAWSRKDDPTKYDTVPTTFVDGTAVAMVTHFSTGYITSVTDIVCDENVSSPRDTNQDGFADKCECNTGFMDLDGMCIDIDECLTDNGGCDARTTCTNRPGSSTCGSCPQGFTGNGDDGCADVNECETDNGGCDENAECNNTEGSFTCGDCAEGYTGGGDSGCVDINECLTDNGGCASQAACNNTPGGRTCGNCPNGYTGTGTTGCTDINECETGNGGCDSNVACTNTPGGRTCGDCPQGYEGTGTFTCTDINECSTANGGCDSHVDCTNIAGGRTCGDCPSGYTGEGDGVCEDVNECLVNMGGCDSNVTCTNTDGGRTCGPCPQGWTGNGEDGCSAPVGTCTDEIKNGSETAVDCGGSCPNNCANGSVCVNGGDCISGYCSQDLLCAVQPTPTCSDGIKNGNELDIDCGGSCGPCGDEEDAGVAPTCNDGIKNGNEVDVDCGGSCEPCAVEPTCEDEAKNGDETDVDCGGGTCDPCGSGLICEGNGDCESNYCDNLVCMPAPTCSDNTENGDETGEDCGGTCPNNCANGEGCVNGGDCVSGNCVQGTCAAPAPTCDDEIKNGDETGEDCGGTCPNNCANGDDCVDGGDCVSGYCSQAGVCAVQPATCDDNTENGDETGEDCGGSCPNNCANGEGCLTAGDCTSGYCTQGGLCAIAPATCNDGIQNGGESAIDCGGSCGPCEDEDAGAGDPCEDGIQNNGETGIDCGGSCEACVVAPTCDDEEKNGDETDEDCGGGTCEPCGSGLDCVDNADCDSGNCDNLVCMPAPTCSDNTQNGNETGQDCGGSCPACLAAVGAACDVDGDCTSDVCQGGTCRIATCGNNALNGNMAGEGESGIDCGGDDCAPCQIGGICYGPTDCTSNYCAWGSCAAGPICGNGILDVSISEECDDANTADGDGCSSTCQTEAAPVCGNGIEESGETCDDSNTANGDGCSSTCQTEAAPVCGNGIEESGETCDDSNTANGDGCSSTCQTEAPSSAKAITTFSIGAATGVITGMDIAVTVPNGSDLSMLTPTIVHTGASVSPNSGALVDFSMGDVVFTVTAADTTTEEYTVTVTEAM